MSDFEKEYYEAGRFWEGEAVQDENNIRRIRVTESMIPSDTSSLADIGCGNGVFVNYLKEKVPNLNLLAIDRSKTALKFVKTESKEGDIADIPLPDKSYDCVSCLEVIEHLPVGVYKKALSELARISKKYVIISVPYDESLEKNQTQCPQCKSLFNADLHLRNYSDKKMENLLEELDFECISINKTGEQVGFKGHDRFTRLFYPEHRKVWRSPICPICGYKEETRSNPGIELGAPVSKLPNPGRSLISYFTFIPKLFWPKEKKYYWIIGLYKRK